MAKFFILSCLSLGLLLNNKKLWHEKVYFFMYTHKQKQNKHETSQYNFKQAELFC